MTDLANLLGDVYNGRGSGATPVRREPHPAGHPEVPAWADDDKLDEVFADWTPGPGPDAPRVERALLHLVPPPPPSTPALDDDLAATLLAALVEANSAPAVTPRPAPPATLRPAAFVAPAVTPPPPMAPPPPPVAPAAPEPVPTTTWSGPTTVTAPASVAVKPPKEWQPGDDDIVPDAGKSPRRRRFGRRG